MRLRRSWACAGRGLSSFSLGALLIRIGFGVHYTVLAIRKPHNSIGHYLGPYITLKNTPLLSQAHQISHRGSVCIDSKHATWSGFFRVMWVLLELRTTAGVLPRVYRLVISGTSNYAVRLIEGLRIGVQGRSFRIWVSELSPGLAST